MTSEIRTNSLKSRAGLSTVTLTDSGPMFSGITTFVDNSTFSVGTGGTIHAPATNTLNIGVNNTESLRIDSNSNVKIAGVCTATHFYGDGSNLSGISAGTALSGSTNNTVCTVTGANAIQGEANLTFDGSIVDVTGKLRIDISNGGTAGSGTAEGIFLRNLQETDNNCISIFGGADSYSAAASAINFINVDHSANYGDISFDTRGSGGYGERLRIDSAGNMSLGKSAAASTNYGANFQIHDAGTSGATLHLTTSQTGSSNSDGFHLVQQGSHLYHWLRESGDQVFATAANERLRITSGGKVGIGTNNPSKQLSIYGDSDTCIRVVSSAGGAASLQLGDTSDTVKGAITFLNSDNSLRIRGHNNTDRMVITSDGKVIISNSNPPSTGAMTLVTDDGSATTLGTAATLRVANDGSSPNYSVFEAESSSGSIRLANNGKVRMTAATSNTRGLSVVTPATQINFGATEDKGGFLLSTTDGQFSLSGGGYWAGSNWVATATASTQIRHDGGTGPMVFCFNTGLTAGNNFTPTTRLEITPSGNMKLSDPGITFSDSSPYFPVAWSSTDGVNTTFTIASTTYANLRFRGEQTTGTEYTMGVGAGIFYMAYDDINNGHRITVAANGVVSLNVNDTSDEKMKKNITSLADGAIDRIKQLRPVNFDWKKDSDLNGQSGFIAQEIKTVIPDLVQGEEYVEGSIESVGYSVNTTGIVAHLTKAVQELITKVETLEQDNIALRARVTNLEGN
jgi:hypothetical protein